METKTTTIKNAYFKAFISGFLIFMVSVIPTLFTSKGAFLYYGDFNVQQIPFYMHAHEAIRSGNLLYDWGTDLGGSLIGCYAFYLFFSPFFWITLPFPTISIPWLMPWVIGIKYGVMSLTSFSYLKRHLKEQKLALLGALLFTFSGYQGSVLEFNHFHDVVAFFPLFLLSYDLLLEKKKYIQFILMTAFMACLNYYFFVGEVLFLVLYYVARIAMSKNAVRLKVRLLFRSFFAGAIGVLISVPYLVIAISYVTGNGRVQDLLNGYNLVAYKEPTLWLGIFKSAVMLSDVSGLKGLYNESMSRVAGMGAYIPLFSISGVVAFYMEKRKSWIRRLFNICLVFAAVPVLNSLFSALNDQYYARWFYMPVLIMALMTMKAVENAIENEDYKILRRASVITLIIAVILSLTALLPDKTEDGLSMIVMRHNPEMFLSEAAVTIILLLLLIVLIFKDKLKHLTLYVYASAFITCISMMIIGSFLTDPEREVAFIDQAVLGESPLPDDGIFYRIETEECVYNYPMLWKDAHSVTSFISTIPSSTMDFYNGIGITRTVTSNINASKIGVRAILSCKYFLIEKDTPVETISFVEDPNVLKGYAYRETVNGFDIYENGYFIPMGFTFNDYVTETEYAESSLNEASRDKILVKTLILSDEVAEKYGECMNHFDLSGISQFINADYVDACNERIASSCKSFTVTTNGAVAKVEMDRYNLLFLSVPFEKNFKAYVDGVETEIVKADFGLMAVPIDEGEHTLELKYSYY